MIPDLKRLLKEKTDFRSVDLARTLGVDKGTVSRWSKAGVPAERVGEVARATGLAPSDIRPDLASVFEPARAS